MKIIVKREVTRHKQKPAKAHININMSMNKHAKKRHTHITTHPSPLPLLAPFNLLLCLLLQHHFLFPLRQITKSGPGVLVILVLRSVITTAPTAHGCRDRNSFCIQPCKA